MNELKTISNKKMPLVLTLILGGSIVFTVAIVILFAVIIFFAGYGNEKKEFYYSAIEKYSLLGDFLGASARVTECEYDLIYEAEVGDTVIFGNYGGPIMWEVIDESHDGLLLLSSVIVEMKSYNDERSITTWELSDLRKWLNNRFYSRAFNDREQALISETSLATNGNAVFDTDGGNDTQDAVFLLSIDETKELLKDNDQRIVKNSKGKKVWWWLRSPGNFSNTAAIIREDGSLTSYGSYVDNEKGGVRPAIWVYYPD